MADEHRHERRTAEFLPRCSLLAFVGLVTDVVQSMVEPKRDARKLHELDQYLALAT